MNIIFRSAANNLSKLQKELSSIIPQIAGITKERHDEIIVHCDAEITSAQISEAQLLISNFEDYSQDELLEKALLRSIDKSRLIAENVIEKFKAKNLTEFLAADLPNEHALLISLWIHDRLRAATVEINGMTFTVDCFNLVISGDLETAIVVLQHLEPDAMTEPYHWLTRERLDQVVAWLYEGLSS